MNNQDIRYHNQIITNNQILITKRKMLRRFGIYLVIVSWLLVIGQMSFAEEVVLPNYTGFVNDFAGVIDRPTEEKLEKLCRVLEQKTSAELAIAVVKSTAPLDSKTYAVKLFEKWKIGKKGKDNGVLILLAIEDRRVEIEVGYGLEGIITDARAGEILDKYVVPFFKEGKFGEGLYNGAVAIAEQITEASNVEWEEDQLDKSSRYHRRGLIYQAPLLLIAVFVLLIVLALFASGIASGLFGAVFGAIFGYIIAGIVGAIIGAIVGFMLSFNRLPGTPGGFGWYGGGWSGGFGGGFGFGGGESGGGGAGRSW